MQYFLKIILLLMCITLMSSCGLKSLVVPNIDWLLTRKLSSELQLNSQQKTRLREDVNAMLEERKTQAKRVAQIMEKIKTEELKAQVLSEKFFDEYKDFLKAFLPIYSKYVSELEPKQIKDFEEGFKEKNQEISETIQDYKVDAVADRFKNFLGDLQEAQVKTLEANLPNFKKTREERLERRIKYQAKLLKLLRSNTDLDTKRKKIYELSWKYNTERSRSEAFRKNIETTQQLFSNINTEQRQHLNEKLTDYQEWIKSYLEEAYL